MAEFTVTAKELYAKASYLEGCNRTLKEKISLLETEHTALAAMWEGDSHDTFDRHFRADKGKMLLFHQEMTRYTAALRTIAQKYEAAERRNVALASGL